MPAKTNKQVVKSNKLTRTRDILKGELKSLGKGLLPVITPLVAQAAKSIIPSLVGKGASIASGILGGIPFNTSGMVAAATPVGVGSGIQVSAPSANGRVTTTSGPRMISKRNGDIRVAHREYVADINVEETGFDLQYQFGINPGNGGLFPWLSQIAARYEMYKFQSLKIIYEPQCGTSSTGTLMLAIDYDSSDDPPTSKAQMMSYKNAVRSPLWFAACHSSASPDLHRLKTNYILQGVAPQDTDIKTYDIGNLFVAVQSDGSNQSAGELYVEYVVDLITPQINTDPMSYTIVGVDTNGENPFFIGDDAQQQVYGPLPVQYQATSSGSGGTVFYVGQTGWYVLSLYLAGTGNILTNIDNIQPQQNPSGYSPLDAKVGLADELCAFCYAFCQNPESPFVILPNSGSSGADIEGILSITQISSQAVTSLVSGGPPPTLTNSRARLGRLKPFPSLPAPILRFNRPLKSIKNKDSILKLRSPKVVQEEIRKAESLDLDS
jgi:hypothetical protein